MGNRFSNTASASSSSHECSPSSLFCDCLFNKEGENNSALQPVSNQVAVVATLATDSHGDNGHLTLNSSSRFQVAIAALETSPVVCHPATPMHYKPDSTMNSSTIQKAKDLRSEISSLKEALMQANSTLTDIQGVKTEVPLSASQLKTPILPENVSTTDKDGEERLKRLEAALAKSEAKRAELEQLLLKLQSEKAATSPTNQPIDISQHSEAHKSEIFLHPFLGGEIQQQKLDECEVLQRFWESTNGEAWTSNRWAKGVWEVLEFVPGLTLSSAGHITKLILSGSGLNGTIPFELGSLISLTKLDLMNNMLSGQIPASLGQLQKLEQLCLNGNVLSGCIPSEIGNLKLLKVLWLSQNKLTGFVPQELALLPNLQDLRLEDNELSDYPSNYTRPKECIDEEGKGCISSGNPFLSAENDVYFKSAQEEYEKALQRSKNAFIFRMSNMEKSFQEKNNEYIERCKKFNEEIEALNKRGDLASKEKAKEYTQQYEAFCAKYNKDRESFEKRKNSCHVAFEERVEEL